MRPISRNEWTGLLQDAATDLLAIINEIADGDLIFENIDADLRRELEWLGHRVMEARDKIVAESEIHQAQSGDPNSEHRLLKHEVL